MATTKEKVRERVIEMLDDIRPHLEKKLDELLNSDFIDFEKEDDNYYLPKNIMQALAREMEFQYSNVHATRADNRKINKLYRAIRYGVF